MKKTGRNTLLAALLVAGNAPSALAADTDRHTVSWYIGHLQEMWRLLDQCRDDPGDARNNVNCINAEAAKEKYDHVQFQMTLGKVGMDDLEKPSYWLADRISRDGILGQCANPIPNYRFNPTPAMCAAAQQAKDATTH